MRAKFGVLQQTHGLRLPAKFRLDRFILSSSSGEKPQFFPFLDFSISDAANWHQSQKVEHGCRTTNLPLSNGIKIVSVLQRLHGEIGRTNSDVQMRDGQTDKQTDKKTPRFWPPRVNPSRTKLGTMIEDLEHVLAPLKLLGSDA